MIIFYGSEILWWWWKNLRISILRLGPMALGHNPARVLKFKYKAWWYSIDRKFHADEEKSFFSFSAGQQHVVNQKMCSLFSWQHAISYLFLLALNFLIKTNFSFPFEWEKRKEKSTKIQWALNHTTYSYIDRSTHNNRNNQLYNTFMSYCQRWWDDEVRCLWTMCSGEFFDNQQKNRFLNTC
jgi:hypothetical protein